MYAGNYESATGTEGSCLLKAKQIFILTQASVGSEPEWGLVLTKYY